MVESRSVWMRKGFVGGDYATVSTFIGLISAPGLVVEKYLAALAATGSDKESRNTSPAGHEGGRLKLMAKPSPRQELSWSGGVRRQSYPGESPGSKEGKSCWSNQVSHLAPVPGILSPWAWSAVEWACLHSDRNFHPLGNIFGRGGHVPRRRSDPSRNARLLSWIARAEDFTFQGVSDCIVLGVFWEY